MRCAAAGIAAVAVVMGGAVLGCTGSENRTGVDVVDDSPDESVVPATSSTSTSTPETAPRALQRLPMALATPYGVQLEAPDGSRTQISHGHPAIAYAIGTDHVVFQNILDGSPVRAADPEPVFHWTGGEVRKLPLGSADTYSRLLDARVVDGRPRALVVLEAAHGSLGELAQIDLETGERTTIVRLSASEDGYSAGWLAPDGGVVGVLENSEGASITRWLPGTEEPLWQMPYGHEKEITMPGLPWKLLELVPSDDGVVVSFISYGGEQFPNGVPPVLRLTPVDLATGELGPPQHIEVEEFAPSPPIACKAWISPDELACRGSESTVGVSLDGTVRTLPGGPYTTPTAVRPSGGTIDPATTMPLTH